MSRRNRILVLSWALALAMAGPAGAQIDLNWAELGASCGPFSVQLTAEFDIVTTLPAAWVGWVVDRTSIGACEPVVRVTGPTPFPAGAQIYNFSDSSAEPGQAYSYRIRAVDAAGNRFYLSSGGDFPPGYYQSAFSTCEGAPAVRGRLTELGWAAGIEVCEDQCWLPLSFISELPAELEPLVGTTAVVELRGLLGDEFEGPYLGSVTSWVIMGACGTVPTEAESWGGIKSTYR